LTQWAANADNLYEPIPAKDCRWNVSFVGTAYGNRKKWMAALNDKGIHVNCFGYGWEKGAVPANTIPEIVRNSVISLNFGDSNWMLKGLWPYRSRQIKARVFEVPGYGGFLLTENAENLENFYRLGKEIALFSSIDDLVNKIKYLLANPVDRDEIAWAGHAKARQSHTYDHRFSDLLALCQEKISRRSKAPDQFVVN
jgi:spore maturation protein CgeB